MTRRALLASLAAATGALALDPERLLWTPGAKLISVPAASVQPVWHITGISFYGDTVLDLIRQNTVHNDVAEASYRPT